MLSIYTLTEGKIAPAEKVLPGCWLYAVSPDEGEIKRINEITGIEPDDIKAALDEEERSRIELDEGTTLIYADTPIAVKDETGAVTYSTIPIGIIKTKEYFITVSSKDNTILKDFSNNYVRGVNPAFRTRFYLQIMMYASNRYMQYLKQIDKITDHIEKRLHKTTKNAELIQLLDLHKSLVYFTTALKNIEMTLSKIERGRLIKLYDEDIELLEDVIIEYKQAREMADTFASVLTGTIETFSSVISNNLNETVKKLTSITILIAVPTMIAGFYGINVGMEGLPLMTIPGGFWYIVAISALITAATAFILAKKKML